MFLVTAASGHLGRLVVDRLIDNVGADRVVATARDVSKLADLADRGVGARELDYSRPGTIAPALDGVESMLLVSGTEFGQRVAQHRAVIDAAVAAGVEHLAYTSILRADTSGLLAAAEHRGTEAVLADAPIATSRLRHGWYIENYTENLDSVLAGGAVIGAAGEGRIAAATRADFAAADAAVVADRTHWGGTFELGGPAFTLAEYAAIVSDVTGREIRYVDMEADEFRAALNDAGLPDAAADFLVDADLGIAKGELDVDSGRLRSLAGTLTPLRDVVADAVATDR